MNIFGSIRSRVLFGTLGLALIPLILASLIIGYLSYRSARTTTEDRVRSQLDSVRVTQAAQLQAYFDSLASTMRVLVNNPSVQTSFVELDGAFDQLASQTKATEADQRAAVLAFFEGPFQDQYKKKNSGKLADMASIVSQLPAAAIAVQYHYIAQNANPLGEKNLLIDAADGSAYSLAHAKLQPFAGKVKDQFGYYDIFFADLEGNIVYTYFKEADVGTSLQTGPYAKTNFGDAFRLALESDDPNKVHFVDFKPYLPSYEDQAAFLAIPIFQGESKIGVLLTQAPVDRINAVATLDKRWTDSGLGATGQSLLVGSDKLQRSLSRQLLEKPAEYATLVASKFTKAVADESIARNSDIGLIKVDTQATSNALSGQSGSAQYVNHLGDSVLGSYQPVKILDVPFVLVSEINSAEAFQPINDLLRRIGLAGLLTAGGLGLLGLLVSRSLAGSINKPIELLQATVREVSEGKMEARTNMKGTDELAQLGSAFDNLLDERVSTLVQSAHENEVLNNSVIDIMQSLGSLAQNDLTVKIPVTGDVTGAISDAINLVTTETSSALRQVLNISTNVARASSLVRQRSNDVATAAEQNVQEISEVSSDIEGTARALKDISGQAQSANRAAEQAISATSSALKIVSETVQGVSQSREQIRETEKRLKRLGERTQEINSVVGIINQIAERTSVLALNAGMQAAAAGEAGRGFALVADEVKRLAESARDATRQIGTLVNGIQADTVDTMRTMNDTISQVVDISKLAERAGEQMEQTLSVTDGLVNSVREITATTTAQAATSDSLLKRAKAIDSSNKETLTQLTAQREETSRLMQYSKALVDTVKVFKLPGVDSQSGTGG
jgi:methyl-accepting chemotaxis protein